MNDKRKGKLEKHFDIFIENKKVPVLSYKIDKNTLVLKTMIKSELITIPLEKHVKISIPTDDSFIDITGECFSVFQHTPLYEIKFIVLAM